MALLGGLALLTNSHATPPNNHRLLVLGDSLSAEYGLRRGSGWVELLQQRLKQAPHTSQHWEVTNTSISGDTTAGGLSRLPQLLQRYQPHVLVIELGANDALRGLPLDNTRHNLQTMVRMAKTTNTRVLLLGMQVPPNYGSRHAQAFQALYPEVARQEKVALLPFFLAGIADTTQALKWFQSDGLHPNEAAQNLILNNIWPALQPLLRPH